MRLDSNDTRGTRALIFVLSATAGSVDAIGFLGLDGLFIAHITGNLVILAARIGAGGQAPIAHLLSAPVFIAALAATRLLAGALDRSRIATLRPLLLLQLLLLSPFLAICMAMGSAADPDRPLTVLAAMFGVSAMAVQNALVQISLKDVPSTAVMTTNWTRFVLDLGEALLGKDPAGRSTAMARALRTGTAIAGFVSGAAVGALCQAHVGLRSLLLPTALALAAFAISSCWSRERLKRPLRFEGSGVRVAERILRAFEVSGASFVREIGAQRISRPEARREHKEQNE